MTTQRDTTQVRIKQSTHEQLKAYSEQTGVGMGELIDRVVSLLPLERLALESAVLVKQSRAGTTILEMECEHQHGQLQVVGAEMNWECSRYRRPAHALAGFFRELAGLQEDRVLALMQRWGVYFRDLGEGSQDARRP